MNIVKNIAIVGLGQVGHIYTMNLIIKKKLKLKQVKNKDSSYFCKK